MKRLDPVKAGRRLANYLKVMTLEAQTIARACGKNQPAQSGAGGPRRADDGGGRHGAACRWPAPTGYRAREASENNGAEDRQRPLSKKCLNNPNGEHSDTRSCGFRQGRGIKYFMISYTDLFGGQRAKLVPARRSPTCRRTARALPVSPPGSI
jgi:hypothetical protein